MLKVVTIKVAWFPSFSFKHKFFRLNIAGTTSSIVNGFLHLIFSLIIMDPDNQNLFFIKNLNHSHFFSCNSATSSPPRARPKLFALLVQILAKLRNKKMTMTWHFGGQKAWVAYRPHRRIWNAMRSFSNFPRVSVGLCWCRSAQLWNYIINIRTTQGVQ